MPLHPPVAEDILLLIEKYPDLTPTQITILKSAAAYLVQNEDEANDIIWREPGDWDPRLKLTYEAYQLVPDRIELMDGIPRPSEWDTPNRLGAAERSREREKAEKQTYVDSGMTEYEAEKEYWRRRGVEFSRSGTRSTT